MSVALMMDVHVQSAITSALRQRGVDVLTAQEDQSRHLEDSDLLDRAMLLRRVLFTRDEDFFAIAAHRQRHGIPFLGIAFAKLFVVSHRQCIDDLEMIAKASDLNDWQNELKHLPL